MPANIADELPARRPGKAPQPQGPDKQRHHVHRHHCDDIRERCVGELVMDCVPIHLRDGPAHKAQEQREHHGADEKPTPAAVSRAAGRVARHLFVGWRLRHRTAPHGATHERIRRPPIACLGNNSLLQKSAGITLAWAERSSRQSGRSWTMTSGSWSRNAAPGLSTSCCIPCTRPWDAAPGSHAV